MKEEWLLAIEEDEPELFHYLNGIKGVGRPYNFAYLAYMAVWLIECRRVLKRTGSIYLHCDPTMSHYLKTTMDCIFGEDKFRNELSWKRTSSHSDAKRYASVSDRLLFYAFDDAVWHTQYFPLGDAYVERDYRYRDNMGRYRVGDLTGPGLSDGESGVGIAKDWKARLNSYQTSDPERQYRMEFKMQTPWFRETERYIHDKFDNRHEWVTANKDEIINEIRGYKPA